MLVCHSGSERARRLKSKRLLTVLPVLTLFPPFRAHTRDSLLHVCMCVRATVLDSALSPVPALSPLSSSQNSWFPEIDNEHAFIIIITISASHSTPVVLFLLFKRGTRFLQTTKKTMSHSILDQRRKILRPEWDRRAGRIKERATLVRHLPPLSPLTQKLPRAAQIALIFRLFCRFSCCSRVHRLCSRSFQNWQTTVPGCCPRSVRRESFFRFVLPVARTHTYIRTHALKRARVSIT